MHSYLSKEQKKTLKHIKKNRINSLNDFYERVLLKDKIITSSMANNEIEFYIGNEKKILKQREKIFLPLNENKYLELILRVREFTDLWKYLENERLIYCQKVDHTVFLCKTNSEIFKEILYPIKEIYDKEIIKSTRVNDFDGLTINEAIRRFEHRMAWLGTIITLLIPILTFLLSAYKENIIHFINNPGSFIIKLFYQFF